MMATGGLIAVLKHKGYFTAADWVKHSFLPGQTVATLDEIAEKCKGLGMLDAGEIIHDHMKESNK